VKPALYLIPTPISSGSPDQVLSQEISKIVDQLEFFIVENIRTARRFIRLILPKKNIDELTFHILNNHTPDQELELFIEPLREGNPIGLMSEAGLPGIADPGARIISIAHKHQYKVKSLSGPSSIFLALNASGLNGQNFAFNGYLPVKQTERVRQIKKIEERVYRENQTQIIMETPYRNRVLVQDILKTCRPDTKLTIAVDLTGEKEFIATKPIGAWKGILPELHKVPAIFLLGL
jgi:16S rRNA (cytidine1402-2'-O)-methyltransferase